MMDQVEEAVEMLRKGVQRKKKVEQRIGFAFEMREKKRRGRKKVCDREINSTNFFSLPTREKFAVITCSIYIQLPTSWTYTTAYTVL